MSGRDVEAELAVWEPRAADGRTPVKVHYEFGERRCAVASFPVEGAVGVFDVEAFARTDWNRPGIYTAGEHIGVVRQDGQGWLADLAGVGPLTSPWAGGGLAFPSHGNAMVNLMNAVRPPLPQTMRSGLRLLYPMPGACPRCRCRRCAARPKTGRTTSMTNPANIPQDPAAYVDSLFSREPQVAAVPDKPAPTDQVAEIERMRSPEARAEARREQEEDDVKRILAARQQRGGAGSIRLGPFPSSD